MNLLNAQQSKPLRGGASFTFRHRLERGLWSLAWTLFAAWTPAPLHRWRVWIVRLFGGRVHFTARIYGSARIWYPKLLRMDEFACIGPRVTCYSMGNIWLKKGAIVSQGAHLCAGTHDIADPHFQLIVGPIVIGERAWVAAEAFVGPGVTIGDGAVLGARGVLFRDAAERTVYVGNPAVAIKHRNEKN